MLLHGSKLTVLWSWVTSVTLHRCCEEWNSEKVAFLAFWIYTGALQCKELLSEPTEARLGIYIHIELNWWSNSKDLSPSTFNGAHDFSSSSQCREINIAEIATFCCSGWHVSPSQKFHLFTFWVFDRLDKKGEIITTRLLSRVVNFFE